MVDAEMTNLLSEMRLTHLADKLEKSAAPEVNEIPLYDREESSAEMRLNRQVAEANRLLGVKRRKKIFLIAMLLAVICGGVGYFFLPKIEVSPVTLKRAPKKKRISRTYKTNTKRLRQLFVERKRALDSISKEISKLIHLHGRKKQERFASRLMALSAKCQALDEQYTRQIVYETKLLAKR